MTVGRKLVGNEDDLPPQHPRRVYAGVRLVDERGVDLDDERREQLLQSMERRNLETAREAWKTRARERAHESAAREHLTALIRAADALLSFQGRDKPHAPLPDRIDNGVASAETHPCGCADCLRPERIRESLTKVDAELLGMIGVAMTDGSIVKLDWRERWQLDVQRYLTSREMFMLLDELDVDDAGAKPRSEAARKRRAAAGTKAVGKRRVRVLKKLGSHDEYVTLTKKSGAAKKKSGAAKRPV